MRTLKSVPMTNSGRWITARSLPGSASCAKSTRPRHRPSAAGSRRFEPDEASGRHGHLAKNHVAEVERPNINREEGTRWPSRRAQARKILDNPDPDTH